MKKFWTPREGVPCTAHLNRRGVPVDFRPGQVSLETQVPQRLGDREDVDVVGEMVRNVCIIVSSTRGVVCTSLVLVPTTPIPHSWWREGDEVVVRVERATASWEGVEVVNLYSQSWKFSSLEARRARRVRKVEVRLRKEMEKQALTKLRAEAVGVTPQQAVRIGKPVFTLLRAQSWEREARRIRRDLLGHFGVEIYVLPRWLQEDASLRDAILGWKFSN